MQPAPRDPTPASAVRRGLDVDRIVDAARAAIAEDGLTKLSMRRLGARLGVDPMAVYHHVANKRALLSLVMARVVEDVRWPDEDAPWADRVRQWALAYWEVAVANRELVAAGLADPAIAAGGVPASRPLHDAVAESGLPADLVESNAFLVVDFVHGSALGSLEVDRLRAHFERGLATIITGIDAIARSSSPTR